MVIRGKVVPFTGAARKSNSGRLLIPARLTEARLAARMSQTDLANAAAVSRQAISAYEVGQKKPDPDTMLRIAAALSQPISFFTKELEPSFGERSSMFFRKVGADTKRRNQACEVLAEWAVRTAAIFTETVTFPEVRIPSFEPTESSAVCYTDDEIEEAAEETRRHFELGWGPISNVLRLAEAKGVVVCRVELSGENVEAFSFWSGDRPFIFMSSDKDSGARARFDIAHELGHLCLHRWVGQDEIEDKNRLKTIESEANRFAGAFLLPRKSFANEVYVPRAEAFIDLKARWKVAIQAMVYRCKDLGIFDERQVTNLYKQISYKRWRTREPLDGPGGLPLEKPALMRQVAELAIKSGRMSAFDIGAQLALSTEMICQLTGMSADVFAGEDVQAFSPTLK